jgi:hypothetical protein
MPKDAEPPFYFTTGIPWRFAQNRAGRFKEWEERSRKEAGGVVTIPQNVSQYW